MDLSEIKELVQTTLQTQLFGVYNTIRNEQPHSTLVGFAPTPDLTKVIIMTPKNTRKYVNTQLYHKVTLFISTTTNDPKNIDQAITISILGTAEVSEKIDTSLLDEYKSYYIKKNKHMELLADSIKDMIIISVDQYEIVKNLQQSIIKTDPEIRTLLVRQIHGIGIITGQSRGKAKKIDSSYDIKKYSEENILVLDKINESVTLNNFKGKGLVIAYAAIPKNIEKMLKDLKIPTIIGIGQNLDLIEDGDEITINGSLGIIIFHKIKE